MSKCPLPEPVPQASGPGKLQCLEAHRQTAAGSGRLPGAGRPNSSTEVDVIEDITKRFDGCCLFNCTQSLGFHHICSSPTRLLPKRCVRPKLWSIKLLQHFEDSLQRESQIGNRKCPEVIGETLQNCKEIWLPEVPWGFLQSHTLAKQISSACMCSCALTKERKKMDTNGR